MEAPQEQKPKINVLYIVVAVVVLAGYLWLYHREMVMPYVRLVVANWMYVVAALVALAFVFRDKLLPLLPCQLKPAQVETPEVATPIATPVATPVA